MSHNGRISRTARASALIRVRRDPTWLRLWYDGDSSMDMHVFMGHDNPAAVKNIPTGARTVQRFSSCVTTVNAFVTAVYTCCVRYHTCSAYPHKSCLAEHDQFRGERMRGCMIYGCAAQRPRAFVCRSYCSRSAICSLIFRTTRIQQEGGALRGHRHLASSRKVRDENARGTSELLLPTPTPCTTPTTCSKERKGNEQNQEC